MVYFQVALVDVLTTVGIHPDGILGHSVGELGCAYADGAFTAEQTVLAAYWRGRCILESKLPHGAMAAVGKPTVSPDSPLSNLNFSVLMP
jgi:fatty acid synthase